MNLCRDVECSITWPTLIKGVLIRRYKRFLADVMLEDGSIVTAHCPNSGSMKGCSEPGRPIYLSMHNNPRRKLAYTWEIIDMGTSLVGINTLVPNKLVKRCIACGAIDGLKGYKEIRTEVAYADHSRIDILLQDEEELCYVEVKNCTLVEDGTALFPDAVTIRGLKHLLDLQEEIKRGNRAVMFYLVQRMDAKRFAPADMIDPAYGEQLRRAVNQGLEIFVYDAYLDLEKVHLNRELPVIL